MGYLEAAGCALIAFSAPLCLFIFFVASDPLRVIIFVGSAFFWLLSLLVSSLIWFAIVPLRNELIFAAFICVLSQEIFRFLYYFLLKKAEQGLEKVSAQGMHIEGVHSLKNAKPTMAFVSGLGYGVMSGAFSLANIISTASGPGTIGLPEFFKLSDYFGDYTFFLMSSFNVSAMMLMHVAISVIFWYGCERKQYIYPVAVAMTHLTVTGLTLLNRKKLHYYTTPVVYLATVAAIWISYLLSGGSARRFANFLKRACTCAIWMKENEDEPSPEPEQQW